MLLSSINGTAPSPADTAPAARAEIRLQGPAPAPAVAKAASMAIEIPAPDEVAQAVETLNEFTAMVAQDVRFTMDEESGRTIVRVVDTATDEVLRQFPSAEALSIARSIDKMQGLLIREKA